MPRRLTKEQLEEIAGSLAAANGDVGVIVAEWARLYGASPQWVYARAREGGYDSGRRTRSDSGSTRSTASVDAIEKAAMLKFASSTNKYNLPMSAEDAIDVAGVAHLGVKPHHVNARLREMQINRQAVQKGVPRIARATAGPNEEHQFDTSPCGWQLKKRERLGWNPMHGRDEGKAKKGRPVIRYVLTDHFTGTIAFQYQCAHESFAASARFFHWAWTPKPDPDKWPFCGVPEVLYLDQGPTFKSGHTKQLCENLGVDLVAKQPSGTRSRSGKMGSPAALGSVEGAHFIIERKFEARIRHRKPETLEELNEWAYRWCIWFNGCKTHSRHKMTRSGLWCTIRSDQVRIPPVDMDVFMSMAERPQLCHVYADLTIRFKGERYEVLGIPVDLRETKAEVMWSPFSFPDVRVKGADGNYYLARPLAKMDSAQGGWYENAVPSGEYRAHADTTTERSQKAAEKFELGPVEPFPDFAERLANLRFMSRRGEDISADPTPTRMSMYQALGIIREQLGRTIAVEETARLCRKYGDWMTQEQIAEAAEELQEVVRFGENAESSESLF